MEEEDAPDNFMYTNILSGDLSPSYKKILEDKYNAIYG